MKLLHKIYIPSTAIVFTLGILLDAAYCVISGKVEAWTLFVLEYFAFLVIMEACDYLLGKISKSYVQYFAVEYIVIFALYYGFAYCFHWISFDLKSILHSWLIGTAIACYMHYYFWMQRKREADELNELIRRWGEENDL